MKRRSRSQSDSVPLSNPRDGSTGMESPPLTPDDSSGHTKPSKITTKKKKKSCKRASELETHDPTQARRRAGGGYEFSRTNDAHSERTSRVHHVSLYAVHRKCHQTRRIGLLRPTYHQQRKKSDVGTLREAPAAF